jgi:hypothetical protein
LDVLTVKCTAVPSVRLSVGPVTLIVAFGVAGVGPITEVAGACDTCSATAMTAANVATTPARRPSGLWNESQRRGRPPIGDMP